MSDVDAIRTSGLTRYFGTRAVVKDLDFVVMRGSVVGLLGLNGAGKTTLIRMIMGLLSPTRGSCKILGQSSESLTPELRSRIGYTVEGHYLYSWMRVTECEAFGRDRFPRWNREMFYESVDRFGIDTSQKVSWLSRGQRAGVSLSSTISSNPEVLVLDDPALGLDPVSRRALNETILDFCASGDRTVLLSSHLLDDIERVADRIAIMIAGRLLVDTTLDEFRARISAWSIVGSRHCGSKQRLQVGEWRCPFSIRETTHRLTIETHSYDSVVSRKLWRRDLKLFQQFRPRKSDIRRSQRIHPSISQKLSGQFDSSD